jgi:putative ABC transport system permease protein
MTLAGLAREIGGSLRGQKVAFATIGLLVAGMCAIVVITAGRAQAAARDVAGQIDAAGSRQLAITSLGTQPLVTPAAVKLLSGAQGVQSVVGIGPSRDVTAGSIGPGGAAVAEQPILGDLDSILTLTAGRWPQPGEGLVSADAQQTLGLDQPVGWVNDNHGHTTPIVGSYIPRPGFEDLNGVLTAATGGTIPTLRVELSDIAAATAVQTLALAVLAPPDPGQLHLTSPTGLAQLQQAVSGDLQTYTRTLTLITLGSGIVIIAIVVLSQVLLQRKDIGRRRALGAPRWAVIAIVIGQSTVPAAAGAVLGTLIATAIAAHTGNSPNPDLPAAALILGILTTAIAAIAPAVLGAWRDPVQVLRTP